MNFGLISWVAGILLTFAGIKFVFIMVNRLFNKDTFDTVIEGIGASATKAANAWSKNISKSLNKRRKRKEAERNQKPTVKVV